MSFSDQIKKFAEDSKAKMDDAVEQVRANAEGRLREILGDDVSLIKSIRLDADVGKFHAVDAPQSVIDQIRAAGLLRD